MVIINRLICRVFGHRWKGYYNPEYVTYVHQDGHMIEVKYCDRCGYRNWIGEIPHIAHTPQEGQIGGISAKLSDMKPMGNDWFAFAPKDIK